jgi:hypothetical protein
VGNVALPVPAIAVHELLDAQSNANIDVTGAPAMLGSATLEYTPADKLKSCELPPLPYEKPKAAKHCVLVGQTSPLVKAVDAPM